MQKVVILGSTGSIGTSTLEVLSRFPERFKIFGLSANTNIRKLKNQITKFKPSFVTVTDKEGYNIIKKEISGSRVKILYGVDGLKEMVSHPETDLVVNALVGAVGLIPTLEALDSGKKLALANKESLVMAGEIITERIKEKNAQILPIDSEHSAIKQCLLSGNNKEIKRLILTASGGPFFKRKSLKNVTLKQALNHPTWKMGKKITVDSATLMNKGLEVIEAHWFFDVPEDKIEVLIHPQSIVHSMVEFVDGSTIAQLSVPDMKLPIQYALLFPERLPSNNRTLDLTVLKNLTFLAPDYKKFPCLNLCYRALELGGTAPAVLNAANEEAVFAFLKKKLKFVDIPYVIKKVMSSHHLVKKPKLNDVLKADQEGREKSKDIICKSN
ncbi:MAG: 1-deoxy-D-xylulose 5-phosphate reductoisomerase [candidate division Zixibacteria bacterium SM23_73_2]|nr:MAG: 1-deoxy-D-xylulose 5-phosphate reductoisomerase [candidate division Zixibacteria bacterium SM23_73_2]